MKWEADRLDEILAEGIRIAERKEREKGFPLRTYKCPECKDVGALSTQVEGVERWYQCPRCRGGIIFKDWYKKKYGNEV